MAYEGFHITQFRQESDTVFKIVVKLDSLGPVGIRQHLELHSSKNVVYEITARCISVDRIRQLSAINFCSFQGYKFVKGEDDGLTVYFKDNVALRIDLLEAINRHIYPHAYGGHKLFQTYDSSVRLGRLYYAFNVTLLGWNGRQPEVVDLPSLGKVQFHRLEEADIKKVENSICPLSETIMDNEINHFNKIWIEMCTAGFADPIKYLDNWIVRWQNIDRAEIVRRYKQEIATVQWSNDCKLISLANDENLALCHRQHTLWYFLNNLGVPRKHKRIDLSDKWNFVESTTKELGKAEFGRRGEFAIYKYLTDNFQDLKWLEGIETDSAKYIMRSQCKVDWKNHAKESYQPYDILISGFSHDIIIEVKATRLNEAVLYFSLAELEQALSNSVKYIVAFLCYLHPGEAYKGLRVNEEFGVTFLQFKKSTLDIIKEKKDDWRDYYGENVIRFSESHFEEISEAIEKPSHPFINPLDKVSNVSYWKEFPEYVEKTYFRSARYLIDEFRSFLPKSLIDYYANCLDEFSRSENLIERCNLKKGNNFSRGHGAEH